ncbi:MAG: SAM-dependent DNA methyltransferase [Phycisphaerales bacterium]|nr:SAM-dependent DNA methyltransferase [Phycisphaerales bacterium]
MITGPLRSKIDKLWLEFWQGGITNPLTVIEQITFLMFIRLLDLTESRNEKKAQRTGKPFDRLFSAKQQHLRWHQLKNLGADALLKTMRDEVFPHLKDIAGAESTFGRYMNDAMLMIQKPSLLVKALELIDDLPLDKGDTKGDLYEYLLGKLTTAGINGQFRTPRHIIRLMVDLVEPKPTDRIADPACGTAGFLVSVMDHLLEKHSSPEGITEEKGDNGEVNRIFTGDLLEPYRKHIQSDMFHGFDFDVTMLRIAAMNLMLHGVDNPAIEYMDTLSNRFVEDRALSRFSKDHFDLILANPPFKGTLDYEAVESGLLRTVKTRKTELLFLALILRMLKLGGRAAVIVPDGVLFGSSNAHTDLRKALIDDNQLEGVIKLPAGVFKPYAGVATAFLVFTKGGKTRDVFFYDVQADGFSLDDKRDAITENDLPDVRARWAKRNPKKDLDRKDKAFFVPVDEIRAAEYDLSINRYKETVYEEVKYDAPKTILKRLAELNKTEAQDLKDLEAQLR